MADPDHHELEAVLLTPREIEEIIDNLDRAGGHCWGFRFEAEVNALKREKLRQRRARLCGPYGDWPRDVG